MGTEQAVGAATVPNGQTDAELSLAGLIDVLDDAAVLAVGLLQQLRLLRCALQGAGADQPGGQ